MPKKGWRSLTVKDYVYDYFKEQYLKMDKELRIKKGITSLSGFITYRLEQLIAQDEKRNP